MTRTCGFHGNDVDTFYVTPSGRTWIVRSDDDLGTADPVEIDPARIPDDARPVDDLLTPEESLEHCRRIQDLSGETLISS